MTEKKIKLYKIERGIKVPPVAVSAKPTAQSSASATLQALKVGESFLIRDQIAAMRAEKSLRDLKRRDRKNGNVRDFVTRRMKGGQRFFRIA